MAEQGCSLHNTADQLAPINKRRSKEIICKEGRKQTIPPHLSKGFEQFELIVIRT